MEDLGSKNFYEVLGIRADSNESDIRKAYKKQSLKYHPDKNIGLSSDEDKALVDKNFQRVKLAYETLSDKTQRHLYDTYGEKGLDMVNQYNGIIDPEILEYVHSLLGGFSLIFILIIIQLALVSSQIDQSKHWSWNKVFVPIYIIDFAVLLGLIGFLVTPTPADDKSEDEDEDDENGTPSGKFRGKRKKRKSLSRKFLQLARHSYVKLFLLALFSCLVVFQVFVATKLDYVTNGSSNFANVSWVKVFIPYWIFEGFLLALSCLSFVVKVASGTHSRVEGGDTTNGEFVIRRYTWYELLYMCYMEFQIPLLRLAQSILLPLKAENIYTGSWALVFVPGFLLAAIHVVNIVTESLRYRLKSNSLYKARVRCAMAHSINVADAQASNFENLPENDKAYFSYLEGKNKELQAKLVVNLIIFVYFGSLYLISLGLLIKRIAVNKSDTPTIAVVLIPIFIGISILVCCFCCCSCMLKLAIAGQFPASDEEAPREPNPNTSFTSTPPVETTAVNNSTKLLTN